MAFSDGDLDNFTAVAAQNLLAKQYHIVWFSAAQVIQQASLGTNSALAGVIQSVTDSGQNGTVGYGGISKVVAGGSVTANVLITTNGSGRATAAASGDMAIGRALTAAGADGEVISALLFPPVRWGGAI